MFTGIIENLGRVESVNKSLGASRLRLSSRIFEDQKNGDSISVNGVCLTITSLDKKSAEFDIMPETLAKSTLGDLRTGESVNLERALRVGGRVGGHFVTGHIDRVGKITEKNDRSGNYYLKIGIPFKDMRFVVARGSIALDGISLTVAEIHTGDFSVYIIPHTLAHTSLGHKDKGGLVNIEFDLLGKYALRLNDPEKNGERLNKRFLSDNGFC